MGKENVGIADLTVGVSTEGMLNYVEEIKAIILTKATKQINDVTSLESAINAGWQGKSRDAFLKDFKKAREEICDDLLAEYNDLVARLEELRESYFKQDEELYKEY